MFFLLYYEKYRDFRKDYPVHRYLDYLISEQLSISTEFWEILDFIFATSFGSAIFEYYKNKNSSIIAQKILEGLKISTNAVKALIPNADYTQKDAVPIMSHIYWGFPIVVVREFGAQLGKITWALGQPNSNEAENLPQYLYEEFREQVLLTINKKLKLLKEDCSFYFQNAL